MNVHDAPHRRLGDPDVYANTHMEVTRGWWRVAFAREIP